MNLVDKYNNRIKSSNPSELDNELEFDELKIGYSNEYSRLKSVLLHIPRRKEVITNNPKKYMFIKTPNYEKLIEEIDQYRKLLIALDIKVYDDVHFKDADLYGTFNNLIFMRDLGVIAPDRVILANPKYKIRRGEEEIMLTTLRRNGYIGSYMQLPENIHMEGADFLWINENRVIISVGNRTSPEFANIFSELYPDIEVITVNAQPEGIPQHILGCKHIIDKDILVSRNSVNSDDLGFSNIIELSETDEVVDGYSMNIVTVGPSEIIMPSGNPKTKKIYENNDIKVHETPCYEIGKLAGAIACCTLPLSRI